MIGVIKGGGGAVKRGIIEGPFRGEASCQMSFEKSCRYLS
jgi:hypothetical protein